MVAMNGGVTGDGFAICEGIFSPGEHAVGAKAFEVWTVDKVTAATNVVAQVAAFKSTHIELAIAVSIRHSDRDIAEEDARPSELGWWCLWVEKVSC